MKSIFYRVPTACDKELSIINVVTKLLYYQPFIVYDFWKFYIQTIFSFNNFLHSFIYYSHFWTFNLFFFDTGVLHGTNFSLGALIMDHVTGWGATATCREATPTTSDYQWPGLCITDFEIEGCMYMLLWLLSPFALQNTPAKCSSIFPHRFVSYAQHDNKDLWRGFSWGQRLCQKLVIFFTQEACLKHQSYASRIVGNLEFNVLKKNSITSSTFS